MQEIALDAGTWASVTDFYRAYLSAVGAPDWHGQNLDAIWDSLTGGDISEQNPPFRITITRTARVPDKVRCVLDKFTALVRDANAAGCSVE